MLAVHALRRLDATRQAPPAGLGLLELATALRCDPLRLQPLLDALEDIGWIARVAARPMRWALLVDPQRTPVAALVDRLLLQRDAARRPTQPELDALLGGAHAAQSLQQLLGSVPHDAGRHDALTPH